MNLKIYFPSIFNRALLEAEIRSQKDVFLVCRGKTWDLIEEIRGCRIFDLGSNKNKNTFSSIFSIALIISKKIEFRDTFI